MNRTIQRAMATGIASIIQGKQLCIVLAGESVQEGAKRLLDMRRLKRENIRKSCKNMSFPRTKNYVAKTKNTASDSGMQ